MSKQISRRGFLGCAGALAAIPFLSLNIEKKPKANQHFAGLRPGQIIYLDGGQNLTVLPYGKSGQILTSFGWSDPLPR